MKNITILWATSGFWLWVLQYLRINFSNLQITITGTDIIKWNKIAKIYNATFIDNNIEAVKNRDIIIYCVPISLTEGIIKQTWKYINKNSIVLDVTSVKQLAVNAFKKHLPKGVIVIPTHPMFWPYITSLSGQVVALTPYKENKENKNYILLKKYLKNNWVNVIESSPKKHDKNMAIVQWLTHFNMFITWKTIEKLGINIKSTFDFISPIYKILISCVSRYLHQNPWLYWDIQKYNPEVNLVDKTFKQSSKDYYELIKSNNKNKFINNVNQSKKYFWSNTEKWQEYTDKIIFLISHQIDKIKNNIWKNVKIVNIYTWESIVGIIEEYSNELVKIKNNEYNINKWILE
jgi:prephenate dehydrogenase